ncbi:MULTISPECIES: MFS transporter [Myroides]|uniref:MFS transporter n=1 Tax=Myroides albus TaxID=2562892 RepID=A0A6I3LFR0_9FLAO|nr:MULTISPECIES: MFS transporter [Myroides]MTG96747.1 MFS transporter [Myroides albus]MVX35611.1 MFS transporter [Myroides sp. LoEW2-1]UVD80842.1 MFS transporter [Myroides albus]
MKKIYKIYVDSYSGLSSASWMLAIVMLINRAGSMVFPFLGVYMTKKLLFTEEQTGYVLACYGVGSIIGSTLGGWITDKIGNYKVQYLSLLGSIPVFILLPHFTTVTSLALMILLQSTVSEMFRPANSVAITMYAKPQNITRAFSLNRMAVNLGFSIGPAMGGLLAAISYSLLFNINAAAAFIAAIVFINFFRGRKTNKEKYNEEGILEDRTELVGDNNKSPYKDKMFIIYSVFCTLYSIAFLQLFSTMPLYYEKVGGLNESQIGLVLGYSGLLIFLTEMLLVHLAEKYLTIRKTIYYGVLISALSFLLLAFDHSIFTIYLSISVLCVSEMLAMPFTSTVTAMRAGANNKGAYMGVNGLTFAVGFIVSPILSTKIASHLGYETLWVSTAILIVIASIGLNYSVKKMIG